MGEHFSWCEWITSARQCNCDARSLRARLAAAETVVGILRRVMGPNEYPALHDALAAWDKTNPQQEPAGD